TIERDERLKKLNHLIIVPGHAIWIGNDVDKIENDDEWILQDMQKGGSVKTFLKHLKEGVERMKVDEKSLLVFSGGATRPSPSPPLSESLSYYLLASSLNLIPTTSSHPSILPLSARTTTEEYALDSYQNLLFSISRFHEITTNYPERITVVGYGMKSFRFVNLHRATIGFPLENFDYVGIDDSGDVRKHYEGEWKFGFLPFLKDPTGCHDPLILKKINRNPWIKYHGYHVSCPELRGLLEWCPPDEDFELG
ncbi:hypothetical protein TREMEDRAFT_22767, partial [Tremella mesenterica DSM 1558]|uniref:uncharacterized protein n=1 Tax=Tremella mesenterica (strain ATCC 24925 / CBS 8224 / DSM 1558 / NBRC 9311 / NRRL Y-6157 / RJB 2259-6 / UBC 559-6) TaxID=578456 RepID=UPI0003F48F15